MMVKFDLLPMIGWGRFVIALLSVCLYSGALPIPSQAQEPTLHFDHISLEQGLSHGTVFSIVQDQTGFLWFGTPSGLNRYDGYNITVFKHDPHKPNTVSNDNAGNLYLDRSGIIWIGTWGGGLSRLNPRTEQFTTYTINPTNPTSLSSDRVQTVFEDHTGTLWVGTSGGGLNRFNAADETFTHYRNDPNNPNSLSNDRVWAITEDQAGYLWVATSSSLNRFDPAAETFTRYPNLPPTSLDSNEIRALYMDKAGFLWIGSEAGLTRFDPRTETFTHYQNNPANPTSLNDNTINAILEDRAGNFWVGTRKGGLNRLNRDSGVFTHYVNDPRNPTSLSYNDVRGIFEDRSGMLWVATRGGGVNKFNPSSEKFIRLDSSSDNPNRLNNNDVWAIYQDRNNRLWIGTKGGGLNQFDPQTGRFTFYRNNPDDPTSLSSNDVYAIYQDRAGTLWLGLSGGGLNKFDPQTGMVTRYQHGNDSTTLSNNDINSIFQDRAGLLWIGAKGGGLNRFDPQTGQVTRYLNNPNDPTSLAKDDVYAILEDSHNNLWISTYGGGLNLLDRQTGHFTHYQYDPTNPTSLSNNDVYALHEDKNGALWIGTGNGGLNKFDRETGQFTRFELKDGLASNVIYGIEEDDQGNLWLSTSRGLTKFNPPAQTFTNYDANDGLGNIVFHENAYHRGPKGEIFFGGINGLVRFYPSELKDNSTPPTVVLTAFTLTDRQTPVFQPIDQLKTLELPYSQNGFSFEFAALDYTSPAKNRYAYMLEGFDQDWTQTGTRRFASYTNLDPGTYTLHIKGANNAGVWNEATPIKITVTPPFWETWWFRLSAVAVVVGLAFSFYTVRVANIQAQRKTLQLLVTERTAELSAVNEHLRNLTDRLQQELILAKEIQQSLLPPSRPNNWPGLDLVCYNIPAQEVGGDFYAYHAFSALAGGEEKNGYKFAVAVGDVSGKGMPAALLMAVSLASFQAAIEQALPPAKLLAHLDEAIMRYTRTRLRQNCALCYLEITPYSDGAHLLIANAGCISPLIRRTNGVMTWVDIGGMPLGTGLGVQDGYSETSLTLEPGDLVILISDGVIEAKNKTGEMFGFDRLERLVATGSPASAEVMLNQIRTTVLAHVGQTELNDDLTIVALRV